MLRWNTVMVDLPEIELEDVQATILDKDGVKHYRTFEGFIYNSNWFGSEYKPMGRDMMDVAKSYLQDNEYIETNRGSFIPRCNIKKVSFKKLNKRNETPTTRELGIKDYESSDWVTLGICSVVLLGVGVLLLGMAYAIYYKSTH